MKKLLLVLSCTVLFTMKITGQSESTLNLNVTKELKEIKNTDTGIFPKGNGEFVYQNPMLGSGRAKKSREIGISRIKKYAEDRGATVASTSSSYSRGLNMYYIAFELKNEDGSPYLIKSEAMKEIKALKELLDLDILTKEEFDKKAKIYKRAILNN